MKLDLSGDFEVQASPAAAYDFLMDPHRMAPLLPMFKELKAVDESGFTVVLEVGVPQIRGRVETVVKRLECLPNQKAQFDCRGRHTLGMADTLLGFELTPSGSGSRVSWHCQSIVRGTLASLANGVLAPLAKRNIASMIEVLQAELGRPAPADIWQTGPEPPFPAPTYGAAADSSLWDSLRNWVRKLLGRT